MAIEYALRGFDAAGISRTQEIRVHQNRWGQFRMLPLLLERPEAPPQLDISADGRFQPVLDDKPAGRPIQVHGRDTRL
jgi:hypothetical protein